MTCPLITIISDAKPGHLAQSRGLADAIARQTDAQIEERDADSVRANSDIDAPDGGVILAAGRKTYSRALQCARRNQLPAVALMNPGWLMRNRFDLCVIPRHDGVRASAKVLVTEGALNGVQPAENSSLHEGLLLIGGPSKHHDWDADALISQLNEFLSQPDPTQWTATGSRRTPEQTDQDLRALADRSQGRVNYTPASETPHGWVAEQLARCGVCWVTEDSVSMVYEALTAGARVGLLPAIRKPGKTSRVVLGVETLIDRGWVATFDQWRQGKALPTDRPALAEADRVASHIIERWLTPTAHP